MLLTSMSQHRLAPDVVSAPATHRGDVHCGGCCSVWHLVDSTKATGPRSVPARKGASGKQRWPSCSPCLKTACLLHTFVAWLDVVISLRAQRVAYFTW